MQAEDAFRFWKSVDDTGKDFADRLEDVCDFGKGDRKCSLQRT